RRVRHEVGRDRTSVQHSNCEPEPVCGSRRRSVQACVRGLLGRSRRSDSQHVREGPVETQEGSPLEGDFGGSHYTHWGTDTCPTDSTLVFGGIMSTTDRSSIGSSQYTCLPKDKQYPSGKTDDEEIEDYPQVQQVAFISRKKGADNKLKTIKCASCRVPGKSTTTMLTAKTDCPSGWKKQYQGTLISTDYQQVRGELVCLDTSQSFEQVSSDSEDLTVVTEVSPKCGSYPCSGGVSVNTALPCVVCSITKKSESLSDFLVL
ncbi:hypothetical protein AVEN_44207-1, partial [Araneus ventricosus]